MIVTVPRIILPLYKYFDDGTFAPFSTRCNFYMDYSTRCPTIIPASSCPDNYGGACPPLTFAEYGMSGYVCCVGNEEGTAYSGRSADVYYRFSLPPGVYVYRLRFKYLAYGASGGDGGDKAVAEVILFGTQLWSVEITHCTIRYGTVDLSYVRYWGGGTTELIFRLRVTNVYSWFDHRNFTIDDVVFEVMEPRQLTVVQSSSMAVLSI